MKYKGLCPDVKLQIAYLKNDHFCLKCKCKCKHKCKEWVIPNKLSELRYRNFYISNYNSEHYKLVIVLSGLSRLLISTKEVA